MDGLLSEIISRGLCTQSDVARAEAEIFCGTKSEAQVIADWRALALKAGTKVWLTGFNDRPDLDGQSAIIRQPEPAPAGGSADPRVFVSVNKGRVALPPRNISLFKPDDGSGDAHVIAYVLSKALGVDAARRVLQFIACERCQAPCTPGTRCRPPHPIDLRHCIETTERDEKKEFNFFCGACGDLLSKLEGEPHVTGPAHCFDGHHTTRALPDSDRRRRRLPGFDPIRDGRWAQEAVDEEPDYITSLNVSSATKTPRPSELRLLGRAMLTDTPWPGLKIKRSFPELKELVLADLNVDEITLNEELTPQLDSISLQRVGVLRPRYSSVSCHVDLPMLRKLRLESVKLRPSDITHMVRSAPALETFYAQDVTVRRLHFTSNALRTVSLHQHVKPLMLSFWAPNLELLDLSWSDVDRIHFCVEHPLQCFLPSDHVPPPLVVRAPHADIARSMPTAPLVTHPNLTIVNRHGEGENVGRCELCRDGRSLFLSFVNLEGYFKYLEMLQVEERANDVDVDDASLGDGWFFDRDDSEGESD